MSLPPYHVKTEHEEKTIYITMNGFWDEDIVINYFREKNAAVDSMLARQLNLSDIKILIDTSSWEIQSRNIAEMIDKTENRPIKTAVVNSAQALPRMQAQRIATEGYQFFATHNEAKDWLSNT